MAQRASDVSADLRDIYETRVAMAHKLEMLEERVRDTMEDARASVADVVDRTQSAAEDVVDRLESFVEQTKHAFDPRHQVEAHPWLMLGAAVTIGYAAGLLGGRMQTTLNTERPTAPGETIRVTPNVWDTVTSRVQDEMEVYKGAAMAVSESLVRDFFRDIVPAMLGPLAREASRRLSTSRNAPRSSF